MPDKKITDLTAVSSLAGTEAFPLVQGAATKKAVTKDVAKLGYQDIVTDATTARTLSLVDIGAWLRFTSASAVALTIPTNASVAFPIGTTLNGIQAGAGQITIGGAGVTINKPSDYNAKTRRQYAPWCLVKVATDTWDLIGDLEAVE